MSRRRRRSRSQRCGPTRSFPIFCPSCGAGRLGTENSLVQTVGKLTAPGVPDIYQGCELWDLNLVDPDNRRPVDFALREAAMADLAARVKAKDQRSALFTMLTNEWRDGRVELATTALLLALRERSRSFSPPATISQSPSRETDRIGPLATCGLRRPKARCRDGALPRPSGGGAEVERDRAIASSPVVLSLPRPGCDCRRSSPRVAAAAAVAVLLAR